MNVSKIFFQLFIVFFLTELFSCNTRPEKPEEKDIVEIREQIDVRVTRNIQKNIEFILANKGRLSDTVLLSMDSLVGTLYIRHDYKPLWSKQENWLPEADSLFQFIEHSKEYGLFPNDYHFKALQKVRSLVSTDSTSGKDAALWSRGELMLSDAFFLITRHLKQGRLQYDSVTLRKDTVLADDFFLNIYAQLKQSGNVAGIFRSLEPKHGAYDSLKAGLRFFLDSVNVFKRYTYLPYPVKDSATFFNMLQKRFFEEDVVLSATDEMDTAAWRGAIRYYQQSKGLKVTGKVNENTVQSLNNTDWEKFKRIAINLDRYKLLPDTLPETFVWVNLPSYRLKLIDFDTIALESRVIVGTARTRTPLLTSEISNFITYPQWTVPYSIIFKEMLPQIQKNTDYLRKQNLMVVDKNDSIIDPAKIDWSKLSKKRFPYLLKQRQGDDNSLGVLKFNFANKYSVYLHDTNARWLFSKSARALSHGCVRVKEWEKLSHFLVRNDPVKYHPDTLRNWIRRQEKHVIYGFRRIPIFIRYFTCEGSDGKVKFYDDIYGEDKILRQRYFADKSIN
ncbi:MAG: L,D-transpeptidase family protein [Chitinophagaceae bacterium]|nr:L,D-transpeptidase family protein [Chitinophagaceae bacterium]